MKVCSDLGSVFKHIVSEESTNSVLLLFLCNLDVIAREGYVSPTLPVHQGQQIVECTCFHSHKKEVIGLLCDRDRVKKMRIHNIFQKRHKEGHYQN